MILATIKKSKRRSRATSHALLATVLLLFACISVPAYASDDKPNHAGSSTTPFSVGIGFRASTLGLGGDVAVPVMHRANLRAGFNAFNYNRTFDSNGIHYNGALDLRSAEAQFDYFPFAGSFHLSPGVMFWNGNNLNARSAVPSNQTFHLGNTTWRSNPADPITGTGKMSLAKAGPMFTLGWGNLVPRNAGKHFSFSFEGGFVYQGSPDTRLAFTGSACPTTGPCLPVAINPIFQADVVSEQRRLNDKASPFRFYPIVSTGVGYRF